MATLLRPLLTPFGRRHGSIALDRLRACPSVPLGRWPTPLERLGARPSRLWVKRDDLSGWGRGGAKARKLEYLLGHLQANCYTDVVALTGNVTNLVFDIAPALDAYGIRGRILVVNYPRAGAADREAIFAGVGDRVELLGANWAAAVARALVLWSRARLAGRRPFLLLPGAAHPGSVIGNACGMIELAEQLDAHGVTAEALVCVTVATGTTLAGFLLGAHAVAAAGGPQIRVVGVAVDRAPLTAFTLALIQWTESFLGLPSLVPASDVEIVALEGGLPFARFGPAVEAVCHRVWREYELRLDPIFGGKTWYLMEQRLLADPRLTSRPIVYWHCGFTPEWRGLGSALRVPARSP